MSSSSSHKYPRLVAETSSADTTGQGETQRRSASPQEASAYLAGEVIGDRYRLVRELGRGGMGVVWVAHSLVLGVDVALKLIRASAAGPAVASRMAREAHAAARLGHPALVRVFDFGWTSRGDPFLVMELVQGETLSALLQRETRIPAIRAVQMLLPIADGLRLAHDKDIIHRDIKPDNIFLATDALGRTQPKLLDFGIAKVEPAATHDARLTQVGVVLGSPEYMSPEQALGTDDVDERTDVWSLCVVLYELVTGSLPFRKSNYNALMQAIIHDDPTPTSDHAAGDAGLWVVIRRGLSKEREHRWANMSELGEALALWLYEHGIKEDLSGNSIRAVWLDAALSGMRVDVPRSSPPVSGEASLGAARRLPTSATRARPGGSAPWSTPTLVGRTRRGGRTREAILLALAIGAAIGALVAAFALGSKTKSLSPPVAETARSAMPARGVAKAPQPAVSAELTPAPSTASPVAPGLERPSPPTQPSVKRPATKTTSSIDRNSARARRTKHDFGF